MMSLEIKTKTEASFSEFHEDEQCFLAILQLEDEPVFWPFYSWIGSNYDQAHIREGIVYR